jgi:hypothetical protein
MSHDTQHDHHDTHHEEKPIIEFRTALLFVLTIVGLFLGIIEFTKQMSHDTDGHHPTTEHHDNEHGDAHENAEHSHH